ncbi:hypothetical protein Tco_0493870 [Tanacetum coccineum]
MPKTRNGETPFSMAYGIEVVIPADIGMPTRRTAQRINKENDVELRLNLNLLEKRREIAMIRDARQKQQAEKYYNQRVHHKQFRMVEFVLRKNKVSKAENMGKLGQKWEGPYEVTETYRTGAYKLITMISKPSGQAKLYKACPGSNIVNVQIYRIMKRTNFW